MDTRQIALVVIITSVGIPGAAAQAPGFAEIALPAGSMPEGIATGPDGAMWVTLSGAWALARHDPRSGDLHMFNLTVGPTKEREELFDVLLDSDGRVWTASTTHAFRLDPQTGSLAAFPLPSDSQLSGGIVEAPGLGIVVAEVTAEKLAVLDPASGALVRELETGGGPFGPLDLARGADGRTYGSATYADAFFVLSDGVVEARGRGLLRGPVGLVVGGESAWFAEMGGSSVSRSSLDGTTVERFPTSPSPYFQISGPAGIALAPDGTVWFVEHFADRIAHLDVERGILEEVQVPGAPGTNAQFLVLSGGRAWVPLTSRDKVAGLELRDVAEPPFTFDQDRFEVPPGGEFRVRIQPTAAATGGEFVIAAPEESFGYESESGGTLRLTVGEDTPPGTHRVLISYDTTAVALGRYITVVVEPETAGSPALGAAGLVAALVGAAIVVMRGRTRG